MMRLAGRHVPMKFPRGRTIPACSHWTAVRASAMCVECADFSTAGGLDMEDDPCPGKPTFEKTDPAMKRFYNRIRKEYYGRQ